MYRFNSLKLFFIHTVCVVGFVISLCANKASADLDGRFSINIINNTGTYADSQVYIYPLAVDEQGTWCHLLASGEMVPVNPADATAPGHLTKGGINFANYAFKLSEMKNFKSPAYVGGGRIYISLGSPLYLPISKNAWGGPDLLNPNDPNNDVIYDWYEYTYAFNKIPFGGNTTAVDQFGFPMTAKLVQTEISYNQTVGIELSREEVFNRYKLEVAPAFRELASAYRIVAPRSSRIFKTGGAYANYLQPAIDSFWTYYTSHPFVLNRQSINFTGGVVGGKLQFTRAGLGPYEVDKPTTADIMECSGALARAGMSTSALELGAEMCAAFNRGVAMTPDVWWTKDKSKYYPSVLQNDFAAFWHKANVSMDQRSYAFAYDDVNDQSSVKILPNSNPPTSLTLTIQPIKSGTPIHTVATTHIYALTSNLYYDDATQKIIVRYIAGKNANILGQIK